MAEPGRTLIVGPNWVGDMVMTEPVIALLNGGKRLSTVDVMAPGHLGDIVRRMPEAGRFIDLPFDPHRANLRGRLQLARKLRGQYEYAIVIPTSFISALIPWWAGIVERRGYVRELRFGLINRIAREQTSGARRVTFLSYHHLGGVRPGRFPILAPDVANRSELLETFGLAERRFVVLFPGAEGGDAKKWPAAHFGNVARHLMGHGFAVAVLGGRGDTVTTAAVSAAAPGAIDLGGRTRLGDAIDIISAATAAVGNDTGLMHIAAAVAVPVVGLYGSTAVAENPPLIQSSDALSLNLPCSPCRQRTCPLQHHRCLVDLAPQLAIAALEKLLQQPSGATA